MGHLSKYIDARPMRSPGTLNQRDHCGNDPGRLANALYESPGAASRLDRTDCYSNRDSEHPLERSRAYLAKGTLCAAKSLHSMRRCLRTYFNIKEGKRSVQHGMMHGTERPADYMLGSNTTDASSEKAKYIPESIGNTTL